MLIFKILLVAIVLIAIAFLGFGIKLFFRKKTTPLSGGCCGGQSGCGCKR